MKAAQPIIVSGAFAPFDPAKMAAQLEHLPAVGRNNLGATSLTQDLARAPLAHRLVLVIVLLR